MKPLFNVIVVCLFVYCASFNSCKEIEENEPFSIKFLKDELTMGVGEVEKLELIMNSGNPLADGLKWVSTNNDVLNVNQDGTVEALSIGVARIMIYNATSSSEPMAVCTVNVVKMVDVISVKLYYKDYELTVGEKFELDYKLLPIDATHKGVIWTSSDDNVVSVENGILTAKSVGTAIIEVKGERQADKSGACNIVVKGDFKTVWTESFEGYIDVTEMSDWTFIDTDDDGLNWQIVDLLDVDHTTYWPIAHGRKFMTSESNNFGTALNPDNTMLTPDISISAGEYFFSWCERAQDIKWSDEKYAIYLTDENFNIDNKSTYSILYEGMSSSHEELYIQHSVAFDAPSKEFKIAIRHYDSTDQFRINVDFLRISELNPVENGSSSPYSVSAMFNSVVNDSLIKLHK